MSQKAFSEQVKKHFGYLIDDYGFSVADAQHHPAFGGWRLVVFQSRNTLIRVELDRGRVLVDLGPHPEVPLYSFSLSTVLEFLAPDAEEPAYVFPEKWGDYSKVDWQVRRLARVLLQYCTPILEGKFSKWKEVKERRRKKVEEEYKTITDKDLPESPWD